MPYLTCPQCHASFNTSLVYLYGESCPRCDAPLHPERRHFRDHLRIAGFRRSAGDPVDWEAVTGAQYADRRYVSGHRKLDM